MRFLTLLFVSLLSFSAYAQRQLGAEAGKFDFYVLALSWSPSFCAAAQERGREARGMQCAGDKPFSFVVHGLWPQFTKGFPEYCKVPAEKLEPRIVSAMLDIMPAPGLVRYQWEKHGTCSGLSANSYFETVRKARAAVKIPTEYDAISEYKSVSPQEVEAAFMKANPSLKNDMIAVQCDQRHLREVRVCIGRDFNFTACPETDRRTCRREKLVMPPARKS